MFQKKWLKSTQFVLPIISIGNLNTGGTGKTPHTQYLIELLKDEYPLAVLSRGYQRKTSGFLEVTTKATAENVGDEPLFYKWKNPEIIVAVSENRVIGVTELAAKYSEKIVVLLDDAFQHRSIKAGIQILLTRYNELYTTDYLLPLGNLRETAKNAERADIIIVTKCPDISKKHKNEIRDALNPLPHQYLFFSSIQYEPIYALTDHSTIKDEGKYFVLLVTGIAKSTLIEHELMERFKDVYLREFPDHHNFQKADVESIIRTYKNISTENKCLITTEKDATRLYPFMSLFEAENIKIYCLPIRVYFEKEEKERFNKLIKHYLSITLPIEIEAEETHEI